MAIQDDNTILSKGDLKAYHEAIAPMLGGTLLSRTNVSDHYSTEEKIVGVWVNGKPLYQKTIAITIGSGVQSVVYSFPEDNIENLVDCSGYIYWTPAEILPIQWYSDADWNISAKIAGNQNIIIATHGYNGKSGYITVQYTKTTDTAGSATTTPGAYDINFPNTWKENTEIYFGNGLYGYRATGTVGAHSASAYYNIGTFNSGNMGTASLYSYGGYIQSAAMGVKYPIGTKIFNSSGITRFESSISIDNNGSFIVVNGHNGDLVTTAATDTYDVWVTYTK